MSAPFHEEAPPPGHRAAWKVMLDHHGFHADDHTAAHLSARQQGMPGRMDGPMIRAIRAGIARTLGRG